MAIFQFFSYHYVLAELATSSISINFNILFVIGSPTFGPTPISRSWKISDLEKFIIKSFPNKPLEEVGFTFYRCAKGGGRLMEPLNATSIIELSKKVSAGRVFIVPLNPIPFDATAEDNREKEEEKQKEVCLVKSIFRFPP